MNKIQEYFMAERNESLVFILLGLISVVLSFYFWLIINQRFYNGMGWPLLFIALIQLGVGGIIYLRSPGDVKRVSTFAENSPKNIRNIEIPRMEKVMKGFALYRYIEMALIVIGLILFLWGFEGGFMRGVGLGIIIQSGIMLLADSFAENRGHHYLNFLRATF